MFYTGVGSRKAPQRVLALMTAIAYKMAWMGYDLYSGHALGSDRAFEAGAGNKKQLFYANQATTASMAIAASFWKPEFPVPFNRMKLIGQQLHGRNPFQVLGLNLNERAEYCLCWTKDGCNSHATRTVDTGGTGTAISIANANGIYVTNLQRPEEFQLWDQWVRA